MRPSVEALPGDSNAAVTVVSTDAANENMSNQEMDMTESLFSERDMPRPRADVTYQSRRYRHITVFGLSLFGVGEWVGGVVVLVG